MKLNNLSKFIIVVAVSEFVGILGSIFTIPSIPTWYATLNKPALNSPAWLFGPVWTILFALMGIAFFLVWKQHSHILKNVRILRMWRTGIAVFFVQLALNTLWSIIFFGFHSPGGALIEVVFLWSAILATIIAFGKVSKTAAWLLVPYILWVSFAVYLNFAIWVLN